MAKKRDDEIVNTFTTPLDETVASILNEETRRRDEMQLSPDERQRLLEQRRKDAARKQAQKQKAKTQNKVLLVIPPDLMERINGIANWQSITGSQVVTFLLYEAVAQYEQGDIRLEDHKQASYNPRYDFELIHPNDTTRQNRRSAKKKKNGWG
jgi:hypothetical protein